MFQRIVDVVEIRNAKFAIGTDGQQTIEFSIWVQGNHITDAFEFLDDDFNMVEEEDRYLNQEEPRTMDPRDGDDFWKYELYDEISDEELGNDQIFECIPEMLFRKLEVEIEYLKASEKYRYTLALLQSAAVTKNDAEKQRLVGELSLLGEKLEGHAEHLVDWMTDIDVALGRPQPSQPMRESSRIIDRDNFYSMPEGRPMTSQEQIAHLLDLGGVDASQAAIITGSTRLSIESYRKPSSMRRVPPAIIHDLEAHFFHRLSDVAQSAGYELKPIKAEALA